MTATRTMMSRHYDTDTHRARPTDRITWATIKNAPCLECGALQHETRGTYALKAPARRVRKLPGLAPMPLCASHAEAWQHRDTYDQGR